MNTRRSFFARIAGAVATIALAPELAFRAKLALPEVESVPYLIYACNQNGVYAQLLECGKAAGSLPPLAERIPGVNFDEIFKAAYDLKKARQKAGISEHYFLVKIEA